MLHRKILLFFLLFFFSLKAFPAVFVVTSNADAGPGTLRDALTQAAANGSATTDYINFNLPDLSEVGRTITILSQLPFVSSNLVIDGTTQPGSKLGASDAKVIIQPQSTNSAYNAFICVDVSGFEIYGMYIRDFRGSFNNGFNNISVPDPAIYVETSNNIQIGAPGKGNVFANDTYTVFTNYTSIKDGQTEVAYGVNNLLVYSNFIGVEPDGLTFRGTLVDGIDVSYCMGTIEVGGDDVARRNIFGNLYIAIGGYYTGRDRLFNTSFLVENNYFCYDVNGNPLKVPDGGAESIHAIFFDLSRFIFPDEYRTITYPYSFRVLNNKVQYPYAFQMSFLSGQVIFQGNQLLNEPATYNKSNAYYPGIGIYSTDNIKIGGVNPGEANIIYGSQLFLLSRKSVLINHNSVYCVNDQRVWNPATGFMETPLQLPVIDITSITATGASGTATPLSKVELFWDDDCRYCQPLTYITTVDADGNGKWQYSGPINKGIIASATINGFTSLFTTAPALGSSSISQYSCGNGGSITVSTLTNTGGYQWKNSNNQVIGAEKVIKNLMPGNYKFTALNGTCSTDYSFTILDATPKIDDSQINVSQPSCGGNTGAITGLFLDNAEVINQAQSQGDYNVYTYKWIDAGGNVASSSLDLTGVPAGTYRLDVTYLNNCTKSYGPITLKNVSGPNIDQSNPNIQSTNCGQSNGSITNIAVTGAGTLKYTWWNSQQQTVGTTKDLLGQPAGTYKLEVMDDSQCGPVYTTDITIPETNGITMDETKAASDVASCSKNNGSITGIIVTGATKYIWTDAAGHTIITVDPDFLNMAPGDYTLTASNTFGCSKTSQTYHVGQDPPTQYPVYASTVIPACFGKNNGSVSVATDLLVSSARWIDSQGLPRGGSSAQLTDVPAGTYQLYVTDKNGCEKLYNSYTVTAIPQLQILPGSEKIVDDQCTLHTGGITNVKVSGGVQPYTWSWLDANNKIVSSLPDLSGVGAGVYTLNVNDASGCGLASASYTVQNQTDNIPAPAVSNLQLCSAGDALLQVNNPSTVYTYRLYDAQTGSTPIDEQANGNFKITVKNNTTYYVSQVSGDCESPRSAVQVSVGIAAVDIANAFTPNGDGINDYWVIKGISSYSLAIVQVFTRNGQKVFDSIGYSKAFDGTYSGKQLPEGVYYYIINLKSNCNLLSGSLTIIR